MPNMTDDSNQASHGLGHALRLLTHEATTTTHGALHHPEHLKTIRLRLAGIIPLSKIESLEIKHHMGNYVIDRQTGERSFEAMSIYVRLGMHLLYYGKSQAHALHWHRVRKLLEEESVKLGREYDTPESRSHIQPFIESFHLQDSLLEMKEPDPSKYPNFNAFFAREVRGDARPIAEPENELMTSSPADCRMTVYPTINLATQYWIKGQGFTISKLLADPTLAQHFDEGSIVIARLAPQDYHRWHAPVTGTVETITEISGSYYTVNPQAINEPGILDVFCENRRSVMTLRRSKTGALIAIVAVGAMLVGSIKYNPGIGSGVQVQRGQCLGAFLYGGSTVVVLYPKGEVTLDNDLVKNSTEQVCETRMNLGWSTGSKDPQ
jgi:phosphatidylserine decarboxylase